MLWVLNILCADPPYLAPVIGTFLLGGVVIECLPDTSSLLPSANFILLQYPRNDTNQSSDFFTPSGPISSASAQHSSHNCFKEDLAQTDPTFLGAWLSIFSIHFIIGNGWLVCIWTKCQPCSRIHLSTQVVAYIYSWKCVSYREGTWLIYLINDITRE